MLKIGKYKNLFDNCCVIIAIGLIVFLTIDLYMFNTLEGAVSHGTSEAHCPVCYEKTPVTVRERVADTWKWESYANPRWKRKKEKYSKPVCVWRTWLGCAKTKTITGERWKREWCGHCRSWRYVRKQNYRTVNKTITSKVDNFVKCCQAEHPCRERKKEECIDNNCIDVEDQTKCINDKCEAIDPKECDFTDLL